MSVEQLLQAYRETGNLNYLARAIALESKREVAIIKGGE